MQTVDDYLSLITPYHANRPKFRATVGISVEPFVSLIELANSISPAFDLDTAIGVQLDVDGQWIGRDRNVNFPLPDVWFSFGDPGRGFGRGIWKPADDPGVVLYGSSQLEDETYRRLLRAKILANNWDGTIPGAAGVYETFFAVDGVRVFVQDHQDMTMGVYVAGSIPTAVDLALLDAGYLPLKPSGVGIKFGITTVDGAPVFGFGVDNDYVAGFGTGAWCAPPSYIVRHPDGLTL